MTRPITHRTNGTKGDTEMHETQGRTFGRRQLFRYGAATAGVAGVAWAGRSLVPAWSEPASAAGGPPNLFLGGTDGWISLPKTPAIGTFHPDNLAPDPFTTYVFGFRNVTGLTDAQRAGQKNRAQISAPLFWVDEYDPASPKEFFVDLTNLGLAQRPDLFDAHTLHWHGFRNVIPFFDGEPTGSVSVPAGTVFRYAYRPRDPGTYMFHCHVEDVEHVHMGMTGMCFVRPKQDRTGAGPTVPRSRTGGLATSPVAGYMYNDGDGSTAFDREFSMFMSEVWAEAHWADAHIQLPEWSDYRADFALLNGRVYPDTLAGNGSIDPFHPLRDPNGDLIAPAGRPDLQYQPISSLVNCNAGDRVALRFANLGFRESAMTLAGIPMKVVGKDATPMRGRDGTDTSYLTNTLDMGAGESFDAIFTAPTFDAANVSGQDVLSRPYNTYMLYNRAYLRSNNLADGGFGGQATEVRVYAAGTLGAQTIPNT